MSAIRGTRSAFEQRNAMLASSSSGSNDACDRSALMSAIRAVGQSKLHAPNKVGSLPVVVTPREALLNEIRNPARTVAKPVHHHAFCDVCRNTIVGIRYKCSQCADYDLCGTCEKRNANGAYHDKRHAFLKLRRPVGDSMIPKQESHEIARLTAQIEALQRQVTEFRQTMYLPPPPPKPPVRKLAIPAATKAPLPRLHAVPRPLMRRPAATASVKPTTVAAVPAAKQPFQYADALRQLLILGAGFNESRAALTATNGNIDAAVELLFP